MVVVSAVVQNAAVTYGCVALWITLSASVILHNKWLLTQKGFDFPISMAMLHMTFSSGAALIVCRVLKWVRLPDVTSRDIIWSVAPIAVLFSSVLVCGNSAYMFLSVALIQMLKASMPVLVFVIGVALHVTVFEKRLMWSVVVIAAGLILVAQGEVMLSLIGIGLQCASLLLEATRLILVEILLKRKGISLNPLTTLYYLAPLTLAALNVPFLVFELPHIHTIAQQIVQSPHVFLLNCTLAFCLNLSVFLLIGKASALTMNVGGVAKDCILIWLSPKLFGGQVSPKALGGFAIAVAGVVAYNYAKWRVMEENRVEPGGIDRSEKDVEKGGPEASGPK